MDNELTFGRWLKQRRKAQDLTQEQLAELVGCSIETIRKVENGKLRPSREIAERLATRVAIPPEEHAAFLRAARAPLGASVQMALAPAAEPAPVSIAPPHPDLPIPPTSLVGREQHGEIVASTLLAPDTRLVTLTGPAGVGKTRLALHVAMKLRGMFDGIYFIPLAPIHDPDLVVSAIAQALGVTGSPERPLVESVAGHLKGRPALLILDNFEQVLDAGPLISPLVAAAPTVKVLVTSRASLRLYGEHEWETPALALPDLRYLPPLEELAHSPAVALFVQRARAVRPDFALDEASAAAVAEICARLDGLPLAIELAAARIKLFTPQVLLTRLISRLSVLTGGPRDLPRRQQTMRDAIAWSYDLLDDAEQQLFERLSVFSGGFSLGAVEAVCAADARSDMLDLLEALGDKSLLEPGCAVDGEPRWSMLQTTQEYALERLQVRDQAEVLRKRHAEYFLAIAETAEREWMGPSKGSWLAWMESEHDNLRSAFDWAMEGDAPDLALRLAAALWRFWQTRGYVDEGRKRLRQALDRAVDTPAGVRARALTGAGTLAFVQGDYQASTTLHEQSLALFEQIEDQQGIAFALNNVATQLHYRGNYERSVELAERGLALFRRLNDTWGIAFTLNNLGSIAMSRGDFQHAAGLLEESLPLARQVRDEFEIAIRLHNLGDVTLRLGDSRRAAALLEESITVFRKLGSIWGVANTLQILAQAAHYANDFPRAVRLFGQSIELFDSIGDKPGLALSLEGVAGSIAQNADLLRARVAARLLGSAEALREGIDAPIPASEREAYDASVATVQARLSREEFLAAWSEGRMMPLKELLTSLHAVVGREAA